MCVSETGFVTKTTYASEYDLATIQRAYNASGIGRILRHPPEGGNTGHFALGSIDVTLPIWTRCDFKDFKGRNDAYERLVIDLVACLRRLHQLGLCHGDIRGPNVLLNGNLNDVPPPQFILCDYEMAQRSSDKVTITWLHPNRNDTLDSKQDIIQLLYFLCQVRENKKLVSLTTSILKDQLKEYVSETCWREVRRFFASI
jgi:serine/threonine protein kinase